jgi:hypothetical protein
VLKEIGTAQKKLEFLFFLNSSFCSLQRPKNYGYFFAPELKIQGNMGKNACKLPKLQEKFHELWQFLGSGEHFYP